MRSRIDLALTLRRQGLDVGSILTRMELRGVLQDCASVLDVGCGPVSTLRWFGFEHLAGVEGYPPSLEAARKNGTHDELVLGDIRELDQLFKPGQFDACIAVDVIEHLSKEDGLKLAAAMERVAAKKVILFTPKGFLPQHHAENDDLQEHLSGWEPAEMEALGYRVIGMLGPKGMRGEFHRILWRPQFFWGLVAWVLHVVWTRWRPDSAAAILCVKEKGRGE